MIDAEIMAIAKRIKPQSDASKLLAWLMLALADADQLRATNKLLQAELDTLYGRLT